MAERAFRHRALAAASALLLTGCGSTGNELQRLAEQPPLDYAVLVSGGAFLAEGAGLSAPGEQAPLARTFAGAAGDEPIAIDRILGVLRQGRVFQRVGADPDPQSRRQLVAALRGRPAAESAAVLEFLQHARAEGYDWLLLIEQLQDGPVDRQGVNGQWPLTLSFWLLVGLGMFIPDHTFESRATLRVTVRDLQTGEVVHDPVLTPGPVDLSLVERSNVLGMVVSILVPPFWVHNDEENVLLGVREVSARRLLLSLARDLKSQSTELRLRERSAAAIEVVRQRGGLWLRVESRESLSRLGLRLAGSSLPPAAVADCEQRLLGSMRRQGDRFVYEAVLPGEAAGGLLQVLVRTIAGNVASITVDSRRSPR